jgi:PPOX class probable F420-dependent enzyme
VADTLHDLPDWARDLLHAEHVAHLGLIDDDGFPRVLPVTFALVAGTAWSAIDHKPKRRPGAELARTRWLGARPQSTLTVDHYEDDWDRLAWVQLIGRTDLVDVRGHEQVVAALAARYPAYRERPPGGPLLALTPERAVCWRARA